MVLSLIPPGADLRSLTGLHNPSQASCGGQAWDPGNANSVPTSSADMLCDHGLVPSLLWALNLPSGSELNSLQVLYFIYPLSLPQVNRIHDIPLSLMWKSGHREVK